MNALRVNEWWVWGGLLAFMGLFSILVLAAPGGSGFFALRAVAGLAWLFIMPGWLIYRLLKIKTTNFWERASYVVAFGALCTIVVGLVINTLLPLFGDPHPLSTLSLVVGLDIAGAGLVAAAWWRNKGRRIRLRIRTMESEDVLAAVGGVPLVVLAVLGAISLNNSGTNMITWTMLVLAAGYLGALIALRNQLNETAVLAGIYCVALSLLLMTSLRGWFITGHDVQREFHVFSITLTHLDWNIANYRDAYNACLSITILPTIIKQITGIGALYVFKTVFQMVFALVPVLVYLIARRYTTKLVSILASIYFVAFPTFFTDMPMLNRQEIAFLFMGLVLLTAFNRTWTLTRRRWVILLLGLGVILSHYATTYFMLSMFGLVIAMRYALQSFGGVGGVLTKQKYRLLEELRRQSGAISIVVIAVLLIVSYIWSVGLTATGGNVANVVTQTITSLEKGSGDTKSNDTGYSIFGGTKLSDQQRLEDYVVKSVSEIRAELPTDQRYTPASYMKYPLVVVPAANLPLSVVGRLLSSLHFPVVLFNNVVRAGSALFLQVALIFGIGLLLVDRHLRKRMHGEYRLFQISSLVLLGAVVVLPVLSAQYGVLRAFQEILMVSGATIVLATIYVVPRRRRKARVVVPSLIAIGFLLSSTGVITTALGGYPAQLGLANSGPYYDLYYTHTAEVQAAAWLDTVIAPQKHPTDISTSLDANGYAFNNLSQLPLANISEEGIYPGLVQKDAYVFLGYTATVKDEATVYDNGDLILYRYPTAFLQANNDLLYTNGETEIYK